MKTLTTLAVALAVLATGCSRVEPAPAPAAPLAAAPAPVATPVAMQKGDDLPRCDDARAQDLAKETFVRRVLVLGDRALIERGALEPADAFSEDEIAMGMNRMLAMARLNDIRELSFDGVRRRCSARLAVDGWRDLSPGTDYQITAVADASRFGVEAHTYLLPGAEGFNMLIGYRSTFGKALRP